MPCSPVISNWVKALINVKIWGSSSLAKIVGRSVSPHSPKAPWTTPIWMYLKSSVEKSSALVC